MQKCNWRKIQTYLLQSEFSCSNFRFWCEIKIGEKMPISQQCSLLESPLVVKSNLSWAMKLALRHSKLIVAFIVYDRHRWQKKGKEIHRGVDEYCQAFKWKMSSLCFSSFMRSLFITLCNCAIKSLNHPFSFFLIQEKQYDLNLCFMTLF